MCHLGVQNDICSMTGSFDVRCENVTGNISYSLLL